MADNGCYVCHYINAVCSYVNYVSVFSVVCFIYYLLIVMYVCTQLQQYSPHIFCSHLAVPHLMFTVPATYSQQSARPLDAFLQCESSQTTMYVKRIDQQ